MSNHNAEILSWLQMGRFNAIPAFKDAGLVGEKAKVAAFAIRTVIGLTTITETILALGKKHHNFDECMIEAGLVGEYAVAGAAALTTILIDDDLTVNEVVRLLGVFEHALEHDFKPSEPGHIAVSTAVTHLKSLLCT